MPPHAAAVAAFAVVLALGCGAAADPGSGGDTVRQAAAAAAGGTAASDAAATTSASSAASASARQDQTATASATVGESKPATAASGATDAGPAVAATPAQALSNETGSPSSTPSLSSSPRPPGPICIPQRMDDFKKCFKSCSLSTMLCSANNCCVHGAKNGYSFCYHGCCLYTETITADSEIFVRSSETIVRSGVCDSGGNTSMNSTCKQPGSRRDYFECMSCSYTGVCSPNCCLHWHANGLSVCRRGCCMYIPVPTPIFTQSGVCFSGNATSTNTTSTASKSHCFPAHALVTLSSGELRRMDALAVGDRVLVAHERFSEVFMFTHRRCGLRAEFVSIHTASGHRLSATPGHYLYVNGALAPAAAVAAGDHVSLGSGATSAVVGVSRSVEGGLYSPQTLHGDIVVDGVVASTYTTAVSPLLGHAWLAPLRALYTAFGLTSGVLEGGAGSAAAGILGGSSVY